MFMENLKTEMEKLFIKNVKTQYANDPFLTQEEIDILVKRLHVLEK